MRTRLKLNEEDLNLMKRAVEVNISRLDRHLSKPYLKGEVRTKAEAKRDRLHDLLFKLRDARRNV